MSHIHTVIDTDPHYKIDGITRKIVNIDETKRQLVQGDHNSERFTFEIPRYIDGHDFSQCNVVEIHYENADIYEKNKSLDMYEVDDLHIKNDDSETVVLSWLIAGTATKYVGTLKFIIRFACVSNDKLEYAWNTTLFDGISILQGLYNSKIIAEQNSDVIAALVARFALLEELIKKGNLNIRSTAELGVAELNEMILGMEV